MPKLKMSEIECRRRAFTGLLNKKAIENGYDTKEQLAAGLGLTPSTLRTKISKPESFKLGELRVLIRTLHYTPDEILEMICGK